MKAELIEVKPENGNLAIQLENIAKQSYNEGKHPYGLYYAEWSPGAAVIKAEWNTPLMQEVFEGITLIVIDDSKWYSTKQLIGDNYISTPTIFELDKNGLSTGKRITGDAWGAVDTPQNIAPVMKDFF